MILMPPRLSFIVNGDCRHTLSLAVTQPIPNLESLALHCDEICAPSLFASPDDYRDGAYHFHESKVYVPDAGTYTVRKVLVRYTDGTIAKSTLADDIVIRVPESQRAGEGPAFKAH
jgi:hypothetical protein